MPSVPLPVREGGSTVLVRSAATRGALRVRLFQTADEVFKPGERVRLLSVNGQTRVGK